MPILSAVLDPTYPADDRFIPAAEQSTSPDYGFFFDAPYDYASHFNFDRCPDGAVSANPSSGNLTQPPPKLDFNDQNLFYRRLFRLADTNGKPRFYLCPWLIVPFEEKSAGKFAATIKIKNDVNDNSVGLRVRPFLREQPDSVQPATTPSAARTWIKRLPPGRKLKLATTNGSPAHAQWTKMASPDIDEALCADFQELEITFDETNDPYPHSCDVTITSDQVGVGCVGQLCLVFVKMIEIPTILFNVSLDTQHTVKITQLQQADANQRLNGPNPNKKTGLNGILERCGLRFVSAPSQVQMKGNSNPMSPGTPIYFPVGETVYKKDPSQPARITSKFLKEIENIDGANVDLGNKPWNLEQNPYLLVFFMSYVELREFDVDMLPVGETAGLANFFSRTCHIFDSTPRTMAHECGHAFGLQHTFYPQKVKEAVSEAVGEATSKAEAMNITTQSGLYDFYDHANKSGLVDAVNTWLPNDEPAKGTRSGESAWLQGLLYPRRYMSTDNLMDYIKSGERSSKESMRKDQVERIRRFV